MITRPYREEMFYCVAEALTREKEKADTLNDHILKEKVTLKKLSWPQEKIFCQYCYGSFLSPYPEWSDESLRRPAGELVKGSGEGII